MKYSRWPSMLAVAVACMLLAAPMKADAASASAPSAELSSNASSSGASKAVKKSSQARPAKSEQNKKAVKTSQSGKAAKTAKSGKAAKSSAKSKAVSEQSVDSRDIWLQRAQQSEVFTGKASWYGRDFHGGATASGLNYDMYTFTAAHRTLPMGTVVRVTDQENGKSVMVCVTDRGPFVRGRIIDLSFAAAQQLDLGTRGVGKVELEVVSDESGTPLQADQAYYVRYNAAMGDERIGPFRAFADAAAMHEALRQAHPEAEVVLGHSR
ncbi:rare lipoprotein A [Desulfovibrio desulfuricans]|uniref:Probable endolytic peptidoglycan transglycosylase RlpA n=1 Tax=Desulfovibrio desulfuricans TaxID=876 RepID=A0AA94HUF0_DESDE|nr:septal ring lytic transglycosylase RlpA family lipoprotein [Desulfovibrio sp. G11]SFW65986.1 rare lipoprotein A [Desulfovibrio desulfuricans]SPD34737.1 Endolytic peptidoglycan transglycosylase RlpA [Desulfovibrio sp. G11]